jgi:multidrug efflux pump subunit AcrA (membrane-fusion protein)
MANMADLVIDTSVSESDVASVKVGQSASVVFSALTSAANPSGTTVTGKVTAIDPTSTVTSSVVTYGATVTLVKPPAGVRLGQTGTVTITTAHKTNVLYVSTTAITTTGVGKTVTLSSGGTTRSIRITTGVAGDSTTEVTSGLSAGQTVVLPTTTITSTSNGGIPGAGFGTR